MKIIFNVSFSFTISPIQTILILPVESFFQVPLPSVSLQSNPSTAPVDFSKTPLSSWWALPQKSSVIPQCLQEDSNSSAWYSCPPQRNMRLPFQTHFYSVLHEPSYLVTLICLLNPVDLLRLFCLVPCPNSLLCNVFNCLPGCHNPPPSNFYFFNEGFNSVFSDFCSCTTHLALRTMTCVDYCFSMSICLLCRLHS